jgi:hypothetical protein
MLVRSTNLSLLKLYVDTIPTYDGNVNTLRPGFFTFKYIYLASSYIYKCLEHIIKNLDSYPTLGAFHDYHTRAEAISFKTIRLSKSKDGINYFCINFFNKLPVKITKTINEKMLLSKIKSYLIEKQFYSFEEILENKFTDFT